MSKLEWSNTTPHTCCSQNWCPIFWAVAQPIGALNHGSEMWGGGDGKQLFHASIFQTLLRGAWNMVGSWRSPRYLVLFGRLSYSSTMWYPWIPKHLGSGHFALISLAMVRTIWQKKGRQAADHGSNADPTGSTFRPETAIQSEALIKIESLHGMGKIIDFSGEAFIPPSDLLEGRLFVPSWSLSDILRWNPPELRLEKGPIMSNHWNLRFGGSILDFSDPQNRYLTCVIHRNSSRIFQIHDALPQNCQVFKCLYDQPCWLPPQCRPKCPPTVAKKISAKLWVQSLKGNVNIRKHEGFTMGSFTWTISVLLEVYGACIWVT